MSATTYELRVVVTVADSERWTVTQLAEFEDDHDRVRCELARRLEGGMGGLTAGLPLACPPDVW